MGADESKPEKPRTAAGSQSQGMTREEVRLLMEQQKREYERKLKELQIRTARTAAASSTNNGQLNTSNSQPSEKSTDQILGEQLEEFVHIAYASPSTSRMPAQQTNAAVGKNSTSYSYTSDELYKLQASTSAQKPLYPRLDGISNEPRRSSQDTYSAQSAPVFINNNPQSSVSSNHQRVIPSTSKSCTVSPQCNASPIQNNNERVDSQPSTSRPQPSAPPMPEPNLQPRARPQKSMKSRSPANKTRDSGLNCDTCGNKYGLNIFQCPIGHSSCRDCKLRSKSCGICQKPITDTRNHELENYLAEVELQACISNAEIKEKCPYHASGCNLYMKKADIEVHVKECPFREFSCPIQVLFGRCMWTGKQNQMAEHFKDVHPEHCQGEVNTEMYLINLTDDHHTAYFIEMAPFNFLVHIKIHKRENMIFVAVQYFGTQVSASKWNYELHVYNKRVPRQKYLYSDICTSSSIPIEDIFRESKCAAIPLAYALNFVNEGCLTYKFFIKKDTENVPNTFRGKWRGRGNATWRKT